MFTVYKKQLAETHLYHNYLISAKPYITDQTNLLERQIAFLNNILDDEEEDDDNPSIKIDLDFIEKTKNSLLDITSFPTRY